MTTSVGPVYFFDQHKWSAEGRLPHGLVNILHYTWQELTAGARLLPATQHLEKHRKSLASSNIDLSPRPLSTNQKRVSSSEPKRPILLRHYGNPQPQHRDKSEKTKAHPAILLNGLPQIPDMQLSDTQKNQQKLHYQISDGSSIIYYPSGCMAVCQSCSGQPPGGFYSNVFSDSDPPMIIATITASGHGTVMHPHSSAVSAVWDQEGGLIFDHRGCVTKEWSWSTVFSKRRIVIWISDEISLDLFSGSSAMLNFKCDNELSNTPFSSDTAQDLLRAHSPYLCTDNNGTCDIPQMVRAVDRPEEAVSVWRREGRATRELRKIQERVQCILESWLDFYCMAIGIKCPNMQRMPDVPPRSRLKREVQSAALPSLNSPERTNPEPTPTQEEGLHGQRSAPGPKNHNKALKRYSSPQKKRTKEESPVTWIGPVQFYGSIKRESVILPVDPDQQASCVSYPIQLPFTSFAPLTHCPVLLRAALSGNSTQRRCSCSPLTMPLVTDLEYDLFILGQPPHSHQMLIVCVTCQNLYPHAPGSDALEQLYRRRNKHRMTPCTQSQVDSFRLVRYEISIPKPCYEAQKSLLQQRHNAAPGMILMYIKGKLLFNGYIDYSDHSCPIKNIENQISKARGHYRSGLYLSPDFKFSDKIHTVAAKDISSSTIRGKNPKKVQR
ncbi:uncharacterized protein C3orf20-like [Periophthalmus magnuspinnatus]|uniref:uncharacterized protein C3orf20-like n=1 Tax=Periophthalmus magnuspinnatus TaxID=409849 RepID=UPI0024364A70|nr:uncharacterized protein C3orf20-like [Periophthalmus magnuspinnatus]